VTDQSEPTKGIGPAGSRGRRLRTGTLAFLALIGLGLVAARIVGTAWDSNVIRDPASLPQQINVCGRDWSKDALGRQVTLDQARAMKSGGEPSIVATGPFAPCPSGPCTATAAGPCDTVVFVRVGQDAYIDYALSGGP
jgi:hypothetical protein